MPNASSTTLRRLEDSMEVVPLHELGTAESEYVRMHVALAKLRLQCVRPLLRLGKRGRRRCRIELAVLTQFETDEAQRQVEPFAVCLEALRLAAKPFRRHRHLDEAADGVGVDVLVLSRCERFVQALPLRALLRNVGDAGRRQQPVHLTAGHGLAEFATQRFELTGGEGRNRLTRHVEHASANPRRGPVWSSTQSKLLLRARASGAPKPKPAHVVLAAPALRPLRLHPVGDVPSSGG